MLFQKTEPYLVLELNKILHMRSTFFATFKLACDEDGTSPTVPIGYIVFADGCVWVVQGPDEHSTFGCHVSLSRRLL